MTGAKRLRQMFGGLSIRARLNLFVGLALGLLLLSASSGYWGMQRGQAALNEITQVRMASVMYLQEMNAAMTELQAIQVGVFMYEADPEAQRKFAQFVALHREVWKRIDIAAEGNQKLALDDEEKARWQTAMGDWQVWRENDHKLIEIVQRLAVNQDPDEQIGLFQEYYLAYSVAKPLFLKTKNSLTAVLDKSAEHAEAAFQAALQDSKRASMAVMVITGVAFGTLLIFGFVIRRAVTRPIQTAIDAASNIAEGKLGISIEIRSRDEMASMLKSLALMQTQLRNIVGVIREHSNDIGSTCVQFSSTTELISVATHHQVASTTDMAGLIQITADSMEQIANHANSASKMAAHAGKTSMHGERVIKELTHEMNAISDAVITSASKVKELGAYTREIASIVTVISGIADQTNLLALNAAIEAARAGESGRGFAVVAGEVRALAERTASSTQQIADTIRRIVAATEVVVKDMETQVEKVTRGAQLAQDAGAEVESINRETVRLIATVNDISTTLNEQRQANSRVAETVDQIASMSRTNGDGIHKCAESASRLKDLAAELREAVDRFQLV
ncbi:methyl-accepting chemotaxis protein [Zobellella sp. An-6]|uniref:methyl-accepting chemotaxis protein n=1 Tax=Zobellella sp. An-6 TaxID=3400218 RepID=UPI0040411D14